MRPPQAVLKLGQERQMPWSGKNPMTVAGSIIWGLVQLEQVRARAAIPWRSYVFGITLSLHTVTIKLVLFIF